MWPFKREPRRMRTKESELALQAAKNNLSESINDRHDVRLVTTVVRKHLQDNHISQRIGAMLKEGQ